MERFEIHIDKKHAGGLPTKDNLRVPFNLIVGDQNYLAGILSTPTMPIVWICTDLKNNKNEKIILTQVLQDNGFEKNQTVLLEIDGNTIHLMPDCL